MLVTMLLVIVLKIFFALYQKEFNETFLKYSTAAVEEAFFQEILVHHLSNSKQEFLTMESTQLHAGLNPDVDTTEWFPKPTTGTAAYCFKSYLLLYQIPDTIFYLTVQG